MTGRLVLVAHDSEDMRAEIREALKERYETVIEARDGEEALRILLGERPRVLIVDVALPGREAFLLCDDIAKAGIGTRVVLVASVYDNTRYKRKPTSLYGAHDYVEQHHIHDMLLGKVERLFGGEPAQWRPVEPDPTVAGRLRRAGQAMLDIRPVGGEDGLGQAVRLAELLVADLALYCAEHLARLAADGHMTEALTEGLDEARAILSERVPVEILGGRDLVGEALGRFVARRNEGGRMELGGRVELDSACDLVINEDIAGRR
ncbi:MAG: response regulator [Polyangia bacterium]|jgi:DNA-binding response OmpR family regulator|nr:response regulator [Polyangia bacterium]